MKRLFPASFMATNVVGLVISFIIYAAIVALFAWIASAIEGIWVIGLIAPFLYTVAGVYAAIGVIVAIVTFVKSRKE